MRRSITFRLEDKLYSEIKAISVSCHNALSHTLTELLDLGLRVKKHMENKKLEEQGEQNKNDLQIEVGASSAIEGLLLLRRIAKETHPNWIEEAHAEASERIKRMSKSD